MSDQSPRTERTVCRNCGVTLNGRYCAGCGQRAPYPGDLTLNRFARAVASELSDNDSRTLRTLRALFHPGRLTRAFVDGQRRRYLPPLRLYLIISGVFFLLAWDRVFDLSLRISSGGQSEKQQAVMLAVHDAASDEVSNWTSVFRFAGVLVLGLWVALIERRSRLPLGAHLVFAAHYYCFDWLLFIIIALVCAWAPPPWDIRLFGVSFFMDVLVLWWYAAKGCQTVYGHSWPASTLYGFAILTADAVLSFGSQWLATVIVTARMIARGELVLP